MKTTTLGELGEKELLARLARLVGPPPPKTIGIGDDTAIVPARGPVLLTTDAMVEGTHFKTIWSLPEELGRKALAVNLSDAAAMGGTPTHALVSLVLPARTPVTSVERLYRGMLKLARQEGVCIVGGNVARGRSISVTVTVMGNFPTGRPVMRSGASPGDAIYVTGQPGLAGLGLCLLSRSAPKGSRDLWMSPSPRAPRWRAGLGGAWERRALKRFLTPEPRLRTSRDLALYRPTALIDTSDGLAVDLCHLSTPGIRIEIDKDDLPTAPGFARLAERTGSAPDVAAIQGGEDYELLAALSPEASSRMGERAIVGGVPITRIGLVTAGQGVFIRSGDREHPLTASGFRHF